MQIERQVRGLHEGFLDFDLGFVVVVQFEDDVGEPFEVRIDCAIKGELDIARIESALLRIVIADLDVRSDRVRSNPARANIPSNEMFM